MIRAKQLAEWEALAYPYKGLPWLAVCEEDPIAGPWRRIWTLSQDDEPGWCTDNGTDDYGMALRDAEYAAMAMNAFPALLDEVENLKALLRQGLELTKIAMDTNKIPLKATFDWQKQVMGELMEGGNDAQS